MGRSVMEQADAVMERIRDVYDKYMDTLSRIADAEEGPVSADEAVREMVAAEYNFERLTELYELDPAVFAEEHGNVLGEDDIDIWLGVLAREPDE